MNTTKLITGIILIVLCLPSVLAVTGEFTVSTAMKYTGTSSDPGTFYQDGVGGAFGNSDIGIELCDAGGPRYVGGFYGLKVGASWYSTLVTYSSSNNALAFTTESTGGDCYEALPGFVTVSPSYLTTPSPTVYRAALPGRLFIGYAASANPGTVSNYVFSNGDATLQGDYTVGRSFDQATRQISVTTPQITFTSTSGSFSKSATDGTFGINSERRLALGVCDDDYGETCADGGILSSATFPVSLSSGLASGQVNDQQTHTKYVVLNGLGKQMCIGANLRPQVASEPDPIYYSQTLNITVTLSNPRNTPYELAGGNVDITSPFDVDLIIYEQGNPGNQIYSTTFQASGTIPPDSSYPVTVNWPALAHSGTYVIEISADSNNDINECDEGDNTATTTFELLPITIPEFHIDGVETDIFNYPNVPYSMDVHMENSDGDILSNATLIFTETNGLTLAMPTQIYNRTLDGVGSTENDGIITKTQAVMKTDYYGNASFTIMPTHNSFYNEPYGYVGLEDYIGNYSLSMTGNQSDGSAFTFIENEVLYSEYPFTVNNTNYTGTYTSKTIYRESFVAQVLDFAYHTYTNFLDTII